MQSSSRPDSSKWSSQNKGSKARLARQRGLEAKVQSAKKFMLGQGSIVLVPESKKRSAYDTCVYVCKPGDRKKRMIVIQHGDTWQRFMTNVSEKLDVEARRCVYFVFVCHLSFALTSCFLSPSLFFILSCPSSLLPVLPAPFKSSSSPNLFRKLYLCHSVADHSLLSDKVPLNCRVFNQHDEISSIADLVQGDVLFVQPAGEDDSPRDKLKIIKSPATVNWNRVVRLVNLQCVKGYVITEIVRMTKLAETMKARRMKDDAPVLIKRLAPNTGVKMSTLKAYILQV